MYVLVHGLLQSERLEGAIDDTVRMLRCAEDETASGGPKSFNDTAAGVIGVGSIRRQRVEGLTIAAAAARTGAMSAFSPSVTQ